MSDEGVRSQLRDFAGRVITFSELGDKLRKQVYQKARNGVMDALIDGAVNIRNEIVLSMRNSPAIGKRYRKGTNKRGKGVYHVASAPLFPPRPDSGDLINSILTDVRYNEVEVGSIITRPAYPLFLEKGTNKMDPRPWLEPAVLKWVPRIKGNVNLALRKAATEIRE